jgi:hypothetical protein
MHDVISVNSCVSSRDGRPFVQMRWGAEGCQMTPDEARAHAYGILDAANAAETDAIMLAFLKDKVGFDIGENMALILRDFRDFRERKHKAKEGQNRSGGI